jgi:hybrid cluster-associated redox disulfide protein
MKLNMKMTVKELLERYPCFVAVLVQRKMLCMGCPTEAYHTLEDVAHIHDFALNDLQKAIQETIRACGDP